MFSVSNLSIQFGGNFLFDNVAFNVKTNDKIGLIGKNGAGKSTLLKIIANEINPENGNINIPKNYKISYLPQEGSYQYTLPLKKEAETALKELVELEEKIEYLTKEITDREDYQSDEYSDLINQLSEASDRFSILGGNEKEAKVEKILRGLGFSNSDMDRDMDEFSGGWQMRCELAKILLSNPDCILLDEPTNHLDIESVIWLENFLKNYRGAILIVSHDRRFLDNMTNRTIEISLGKIYDKGLNYSKFMIYRKEQRQIQTAAKKNQDKKIAQTERFIERFKAKATLTSRAQSKEKLLNKLERIEVDDEDTSSIKFNFPPAPKSGRLILETKKLTKFYDDKLVLKNINFAIEKGDKIAFVGKNGEGKSTLSKIFAELLEYDGKIEIGHNVKMGYFAQHQAKMMDGSQTAFELIDNSATGEMRTKVRSLLGAFLFSGDDIYKKIKVLSGGEKSRLALAKLMLEPINFLIMDEPTNHLDMDSKDVLKNALKEFNGSIIIVSHDREFLEDLTNKTVLFRDKAIKEYPGDIREFLEKFEIENVSELSAKQKPETKKVETKSSGALGYKQMKLQKREREKLDRDIFNIEKEINKYEKTIEDIELQFKDPIAASDVELMKKLNEDLVSNNSNLKKAMQKWEKLQLKIEEFEN